MYTKLFMRSVQIKESIKTVRTNLVFTFFGLLGCIRNVNFNVFTLHPRLFDSFVSESLIARAIEKNVININPINWRERYGVGNYKQVDDRPYGGGSGMVLQVDPIYNALREHNAVSPLFVSDKTPSEYTRKYPRNPEYYTYWKQKKSTNHAPASVTISVTPRGYTFNQGIAEWLSEEFSTINILCGRYEGFDSRVSEIVDLELSMGPYVVNGGEIPSMMIIEAVSRLLPDFVTKNPSVMHDSFSSGLNQYDEMSEFVIGTRRRQQLIKAGDPNNKLGNVKQPQSQNLFDEQKYLEHIAPFIEHTQFSRPQNWNNLLVPQVLLDGDHKAIQKWRDS
jgi:tRNA G37 N-methylase TrmD